MTHSYDDALRLIAATPQPAWLWDVARGRIAYANEAAVSYWEAGSLAELVERRFPDSAATADGAAARLRDGRPGLIVTEMPKNAQDARQDLFAAAPAALAAFDAKGRRLAASDEAQALLMPGDLGIVFSSPYLAADICGVLAADGLISRTLPVATRFGMRRCHVVGRRLGEAAEAKFILAFDDIEDRLALTQSDVPASTHRAAAETPAPTAAVAAETTTPSGPAAALEDLVAALADATLAADAAGRVVAVNAKASLLLGESAKGEPLLNMLPPALKGEAAAYIAAQGARWLERSLEEGRDIEVQRGGEAVPATVTFSRVATGEIIVQFRDLTAQYKARQQLVEAAERAETTSRLKSEYIAGLSHELRTPLNAIIGFAQIMEQQKLGPLENVKYLGYSRDIRESGEFLLSLINDLLDLSKAESGRIELDPDAVEIKPIVMSVLSLLAPQSERYGVTLRAALGRDVPPIVADARSLKQILLNLAGNAIKFNRPGGEVEVSAEMDAAGAVSIAVSDDGPGMDADDLKRAMQPYQRGKASKGREGTGLGLPLARALIDANKAQFSIDSSPGRGTTMRLTFPSALVLAE